tara:strand:- start:259 stop:552 length:294 start_codon:yes stop_codon:yes gene_type:complete
MSSLESKVFICEMEPLYSLSISTGDIDGSSLNWFNGKGIFSISKRFYDCVTFLSLSTCLNGLLDDYVALIISSFHKVLKNLDSLRYCKDNIAVAVEC